MKRSKTPTYYNPATGRSGNRRTDPDSQYGRTRISGYKSESAWGNKATYLEGNIAYDRTFNKKHAVSAMFLYNQRDYQDGNIVPFRRMGIAGRASYTFDQPLHRRIQFRL